MKDFTIELENQSNGESYRLKIPRGFRTNLATIPRPVNVIFASYATYATAGLVHDYLYWVQPHCHGNGRDLADLIYLSVLKESLVSEINRTIQWGAVRAAWLAWSNNRHKRDAGESRYFPVDDRADFINPDLTLKTAMYLSSEQQEWEKSSDENVCKLLG
ncbi:hypothetical protein MACH26_18980 [Planctobacterium marinum]|uniref:DUF1353 domain-containing protein n=2 Tax=Planctobacterium marinum TaxID=1631968 RepID=A0AA48KRQ9_9ALTE|nr:hypothetical protein MACH26_18980 [Planctobacterium marinum]